MPRYKIYDSKGKYWKWLNMSEADAKFIKNAVKSKNQRTKRRTSRGTYFMGVRVD